MVVHIFLLIRLYLRYSLLKPSPPPAWQLTLASLFYTLAMRPLLLLPQSPCTACYSRFMDCLDGPQSCGEGRIVGNLGDVGAIVERHHERCLEVERVLSEWSAAVAGEVGRAAGVRRKKEGQGFFGRG
jgi:hypothetical protein